MAKIFITGITGFIGAELAYQMSSSGHTVTGSSFSANLGQYFQCDIRKLADIMAAIRQAQPDIVVHAAALSSVTLGRTMDYYESNVLGTENVIAAVNALGGRRRLIFISTAGVYGNQPVDVLSEDLQPLPLSHYGMSKLVCERMLANAATAHNITIVRPFNIVGPGQNKNFIVPKLVQHFAEEKPSIRLGNLDPIRDYIDVKTCCEAIAQLVFNTKAHNETVNLCAGTGTSVRELIKMMHGLTGHNIQIVEAPEFIRGTEVWKLLGSTIKLNGLLPHPISPRPFTEVLLEMLKAISNIKESSL
jgi:GDP-6-deoxy-D-talose 4-dehydrogenase